MSDPVEEAAERLYGLPLAEFTAARNAAAKELRASDSEAAERVKRLRKPTQGAWALNQAARSAPDAVERLLDAGKELRRVQEQVLSGGAERDELRSAVEAEREAVSALLAEAEGLLGRASAQVLERVRETLHAAAGDPEVAEQLSRGTLAEEHQSVGLGPISGATPGRATKRAAPRKRAAAQKKPGKAKRDEAQARAGAEERERRKAERAARRDVDRARKHAERTRRELNAAGRDRERAETAFRSADRAYREARERCEQAAGELERAHEALAGVLPR